MMGIGRTKMTERRDREIDWQAFLYVSGEMSPADIEAFEDQLVHDQEAREAVAAAAVLIGKLAAARPAAPALPENSTCNQAVGWAVPTTIQRSGGHSPPYVFDVPAPERGARRIAAAATIAASLLVCWSLARYSPGPARPSGEMARELISFWSEAWSPGENGAADATADDEDSEISVPSWMLAAVESPPTKAIEEN
jgi:hypothetical protein